MAAEHKSCAAHLQEFSMHQDQVIEFQTATLARDTNSAGSDKKLPAPVELSLDELRNVSGGGLPNGTWSEAALPNGTW
jgi:hypothetical protein